MRSRARPAGSLESCADLVDRIGVPISFPVEVRVAAPDDIWLSTAHGRETGYIAVHVYKGTPVRCALLRVEAIMSSYGGRPHWGKLHFQRAASLASHYPKWNAFRDVRRRLDPEGRFANPYLDRVLGPWHLNRGSRTLYDVRTPLRTGSLIPDRPFRNFPPKPGRGP